MKRGMIKTECIFCQDYLDMPVVKLFRGIMNKDNILQNLIDKYHADGHKFGGENDQNHTNQNL